jgi:hypothetical protein
MNITRAGLDVIAGWGAGVLVHAAEVPGQGMQWVEGLDQVETHHNANRDAPSRDFRGMARGFMVNLFNKYFIGGTTWRPSPSDSHEH